MANGDSTNFWHFNVGHLLVLIALLGSCLGFFLVYHDRIRDNASDLKQHIKEQGQLDARYDERIKVLESNRTTLEQIHAELMAFIKEQHQPAVTRR